MSNVISGRSKFARWGSAKISELAVDVLDSLIKGVAVLGPDRSLLYRNSRFAELLKEDWETKLEAVFGAEEPGENLGSYYRDVKVNTQTLRVRKAKLGQNLLITADDITKVVGDQLRSDREARTDSLTFLGNRLQFQEEAADTFDQIEKFGGHGAVLMVDIDHFKNINDSFGHSFGDDVLRLVADRIKSVLQNNASVARLGGDEFVILQRDLADPQDPQKLAERIVDVVDRPYAVQGQLLHLGASIGIALIPQHGTQYGEIMRRADIALYRAKSDGRRTHRVFSAEMEEEKERRRLLELALRRGLALQEFTLAYQPQLNLLTNRISGFEALLRWNSALCGYVLPSSFIPLAEELGLILPIGQWVMRSACREASRWPKHIHVAVNVSAVQFRGEGLVTAVTSALHDSGLEPERLELEITESALLGDHHHVLTVLHRLREIGVHISMDDFGTGYSSLSYLRSFPFEKIKIDQSFVRGDGSDRGSQAIVAAICVLARALGMTTIAEGVETKRQLDCVTAAGCSAVQGYFVSHPLAADQIAEFLSAWPPKILKAHDNVGSIV